MSAYDIFIAIAAFLDLLCIIAVLFVERKSPASTIAWLIVLIVVPFVGFIAYIMFGSGFHINKRKRFELKKIRDSIYTNRIMEHIDVKPHTIDTNHPSLRMINYLQNEGTSPCSNNNDVQIFLHGQQLFDQMKEDIRKAEKYIHLLYYIFKNDSLGKEIIALLAEKARAGVEVKVMYDSLGTMLGLSRMFKPIEDAGGEVLAFAPLIFNLNPQIRINYRNHRKIAVVDGLIGYIGGMNIGDEYMGKDKKLTPWRDTHLRITGESVHFLQEHFFMDWYSDTDTSILEIDAGNIKKYFPKPLTTNNSVPIQIVSSGPDRMASAPIKSGFLEMLYNARETILIQTPYFIPDESFLEALRIAAHSDVDVRLMIPAISDNQLVQYAAMSYARQAMDSGVRVFMYNGFLHAKTIAYDDLAMSVGSCNIDIRSFILNFEINAFIYDKTVVEQHNKMFFEDQTNCIELDHEWFEQQSLPHHVLSRIARLFAPLM